MSSESLQRIQDDLEMVKSALGSELPYDRSHVVLYFLGAGLGVPLGGLTLLSLESYIRPVLFVYIAVMLAAWAVQVRHLRKRRVEAPARWRWGRKEAIASVVAIALVVGYVGWIGTLGCWQGRWGLHDAFALASSLFFCLGTAAAIWVVVDNQRWHLLGAAAALVGAAMLLATCATLRDFYFVLSGMTLLGGISSGALLVWQIRRREVDHAD
jgi:hypothetical protein